MKSLFAMFNDTLFEIKENRPNARDVIPYFNSCSNGSANASDKSFTAEVKITNMDEWAPSNKEFYDEIVDKIKAEMIEDVESLTDLYQVQVDYTLYDESEDCIVDEGVIAKTLNKTTMLDRQNGCNFTVENNIFQLGLNVDNELVHRLVKNFQVTFNLGYRSSAPYGIGRRRENDFKLYINKIVILQAKSKTARLIPDDRPCRGYVSERKRPPHRRDHHRCEMDYRDTVTKKDVFVEIFNTESENMEIKPFRFQFKPREVRMKIQIVLNNYLLTVDREDIIGLVNENNNMEEPIITPPIEENPEDPDNGENEGDPIIVNPDKNEPDTDENGDNKIPEENQDNKDTSESENKDGDSEDIPENPDKNESDTDENGENETLEENTPEDTNEETNE